MRFPRLLFLVLLIALSGCGSPNQQTTESTTTPVSVAAADPARGEEIFMHGLNGSPPCMSCHALDPNTYSLGPDLHGLSERAGERIEGLSATEYIHQSILTPAAYLVSGFRNIMFPQYSNYFTETDLNDLIAFLMTI